MAEPVSIDRLIAEILAAGALAGGAEDVLEGSCRKMKELLPVDDARIRSTYQSKAGISALEEFVINTGKPYVDNRLSDYSAFQELVKYFNAGFKSCALIPVFFEGKNVFVLTLLSRVEDGFGDALMEKAGLVSNIVGYRAVAAVERKRSLDLANYFDAAFNSGAAQFLVDRSGAIVKANKCALGTLGKTQREVSDRKIEEIFGIDANTIEGLAKGHSAEIKDGRGEGKTYRATASRVNDKLTLLSAYDVTDLKMLGEEARLLEYSPGDVFMLLDGDTKIVWVSDNVNRILKVRKEAVLGSRLSDIADGGKDLVEIIKASPDPYAAPLRISIGNDVFADVKFRVLQELLRWALLRPLREQPREVRQQHAEDDRGARRAHWGRRHNDRRLRVRQGREQERGEATGIRQGRAQRQRRAAPVLGPGQPGEAERVAVGGEEQRGGGERHG